MAKCVLDNPEQNTSIIDCDITKVHSDSNYIIEVILLYKKISDIYATSSENEAEMTRDSLEIESRHTISRLNIDDEDHSYEEKSFNERFSSLSCFNTNPSNGWVYQMENDTINKSFSVHGNSSEKRFLSSPSVSENRGKCGPFSWSLLPIILSITSAVGLVTTYFFAKSNCHIERWILPYLSYTGTEDPESMVFGLILNTEGFLGLIVVFLAWRYYRHMGQLGCLNQWGLALGMLSCFGVIIVGNFQVTKAKVPHYIGAGLAFIIGTLYAVLTSVLSRRAFKRAQPQLKYASYFTALRFVVAVIMIVSMLCLATVGMYKKFSKRDKSEEIDPTMPRMLPNGTCQELLSLIPESVRCIDLFGSVTEWLLTACLLICLSLFAYEFKTFQNVKIVLKASGLPLRCNNNNITYCGNSIRESHHNLIPKQPDQSSRNDTVDFHLLNYGQTHNGTTDSGIEDNIASPNSTIGTDSSI